MAYIGTSPANGVRRKHTYTATAGQTSFSGADDNNVTLTYVDTEYLDVYQNGVKLVAVSDYASTTGTSVVLVQGASVDDTVEIIVFDVFSVADTVSAGSGGSFGGNIGMGGTLSVTGDTTVGGTIQVGVDGTTAGVIRFMDSGSVTEEATISSDANGGLIFGGNSGPGELIFKTNSGTEHMKINAIGAITKPLQPAFLVSNVGLSTQANVSANADTVINFGTEVFDQNADFASNVFTAPVSGRYQLNSVLYTENLDTAANYYIMTILTSNRSLYNVLDPGVLASDPAYWTFTSSVLADMDAGDTAKVRISQVAGTAQTDINTHSYFSGYLVA